MLDGDKLLAEVKLQYKRQAYKSLLWGLPYKQDGLYWSYFVHLNRS